MGWLPLALLAAVLFGAHNAMSQAATKGASPEVGAMILEASGAAAILSYALLRGRSLHTDAPSFAWAFGAGLTAAAGNVLYFVLLRRGAGLSAMGPALLAATAIVTAVAGWVAFGEKFTVPRALGLVFAAAGIALLARE